MSLTGEIERIENAKEQINNHIESLGATRGSTINDIAQNITVLTRPTGQAGQLLGFTDDDVIGAVDQTSGYGIVPAYIVGNVLYKNDWLSDTQNGEPITPAADAIYMIKTAGYYYDSLYYWNTSETAYRFLGKKNISSTPKIVTGFSISTTNVPRHDGRLNNTTILSVPARKGDLIRVKELSATVSGGKLYIDGVIYGTITNWSNDYEITENRTFTIYWESHGILDTWLKITSGYIEHVKAFYDYETADYVPPTNENDGQAGLVPALAKEDAVEALTPNGWDEIDFNITREELKQSFESASGIPSNNANTYSTDELVIGTWIDSKPLYRKTVYFGSLPNSSTKEINHNISDIDIVTKSYGTGINELFKSYPLPYASNISNDNILLLVGRETIRIDTKYNRSNINGYITIEYTKTTD